MAGETLLYGCTTYSTVDTRPGATTPKLLTAHHQLLLYYTTGNWFQTSPTFITYLVVCQGAAKNLSERTLLELYLWRRRIVLCCLVVFKNSLLHRILRYGNQHFSLKLAKNPDYDTKPIYLSWSGLEVATISILWRQSLIID